jgi:uncharacterized protein (TIGR03790 family)
MTRPHIIYHKAVLVLLVLLHCGTSSALEPGEVLVIANGDNAASVRIARYYCKKRHVPAQNILTVSLGTELRDTICRNDYNKWLAKPIREKLNSPEFAGEIKALLTTYGVPYKVGPREPLKDMENKLSEQKNLIEQERNAIEQLKSVPGGAGSEELEQKTKRLTQLQLEIDRINGKETQASVDSELSLVLFSDYELYRWQPNMLKNNVNAWDFRTMMVCRLDGPNYIIVKGLIDKAMAAEKTGLEGVAYIDSLGLTTKDLKGYFDRSLRDLATLTQLRTQLLVKEENTEQLFAAGECPRTAIYCGWYSLKNYVDAFDFVDGAVGFHISSFEAVNLRDPNSSQWCPAMLQDGITATLGAVAEPYLHSFPEPKAFFQELFNGACLVEAFYRTKPFNSWQLILIGDPMYKPFRTAHVPISSGTAAESLTFKR